MVKRIYAHRGLNRENENTLQSIIAINNIKYENIEVGVEFDIQLTKDNKIVCYHDQNMERIHDLNYIITEVNYEDIKRNVPLLSTVLEQLTIKPHLTNIEIKAYNMTYEQMDTMTDLLLEYKEYLFTSFDHKVLKMLLSKGFLHVGYLFCDINVKNIIVDLIGKGLTYLSVRKDIAENVLNDIDMNGLFINVYTFYNVDGHNKNDLSYLKILKDMNVGLITDNVVETASFIFS